MQQMNLEDMFYEIDRFQTGTIADDDFYSMSQHSSMAP